MNADLMQLAGKGWANAGRFASVTAPLGLRPEPLRVSAIRRVSTFAGRLA